MIRILDGETVYIPKRELEKEGVRIPESLFKETGPYGPVISEEDYNGFLLSSRITACGAKDFELTKVQSLSCRMDEIRAIRPLKEMFLFGLTDRREIPGIIRKEEESEREKIIREISAGGKSLLERYAPALMIRENEKYIQANLSRCGLSLQFVTEIGESGKPSLICFAAGEGIFCELYVDEWDVFDFDRFIHTNSGLVVIPGSYGDDDRVITVREGERDFRGFSVFENIAWCFQNLPVSSTSMDYLDYSEDGISFSLNASLLAKLVNPESFPGIFFLEGIIDFTETQVTASVPGRKESGKA